MIGKLLINRDLYCFFCAISFLSRRKRLLILLLLLCVLFIYVGPYFFRIFWSRTPLTIGNNFFGDPKKPNFLFYVLPFFSTDNAGQCVTHEIDVYKSEVAKLEASLWTVNSHNTAYIGNGKFGLSAEAWQPFYINGGKRGLSKQLQYFPIVGIPHDPGYKSKANFY